MRERRRVPILFALTLVALLATACGTNTAVKTTGVSPTASTPPTPPPAPLAWTAATYPPGFNLSASPRSTQIAIANADTAYTVTDAGEDAPLNVYVTHDRAAHWTRVATLPMLLRDASAWAPTADANDSNVATVNISLMVGGRATFVTYDGGVTWSAIKTYLSPSSFATVKGMTYGVVDFNYPHTGVPNQGTQDWPRLAVSTDHMRSWQPLIPADQRIEGFWLHPASGTLVAQAQGYPDPTGLPCQASLPSRKMPCWEQSTDSGQRWSVFPGAPTSGGVFQASGSGQPWRMCALVPRFREQPDQINCTFDAGATWSRRASVSPAPASDGGNYASTTELLGLAPDDALIALDADLYGTPARPATVYRLAPGATHWQSLGPAPEYGMEYLTAPSPGVLWAFPDGRSVALDPQQQLFVAAYA